MVVMDAFSVVGQDFDDPAFGYMPMTAALDHLLQLGLEREQTPDPLVDFD